jgi:hypothetical protein
MDYKTVIIKTKGLDKIFIQPSLNCMVFYIFNIPIFNSQADQLSKYN